MLRKTLLVDDDADCRRLTRQLLLRAGYEVLEATDGLSGFERVLADKPDIIITDWDMPHSSGLEMIRRVRAASLDWYPYILLVTASADAELGLDTGADDFVSKPIRENQLLPRVRAGQRIVSLQRRLNERNQELHRANESLALLATTDPLSGLLNRRAFFAEAEKEWRRSQRYALPLSCLMLDIDHFKRVNDNFGHTAGDAVIVAIAQLLQTRLRNTDLICRYGGEEFCIWLTNASLEQAEVVAIDLCAAIAKLRLPELGADSLLTVSIGVASRTPDQVRERTLIEQADQALLIGKQTGRNRVVCYEQPAGAPPAVAIDNVSLGSHGINGEVSPSLLLPANIQPAGDQRVPSE